MKTVDPRYPAQIHALWTVLDREVTWLHGRWMIYRQLFGTNQARVELLNRSAGTFFNVLQDVLLHDVQLSLSKLGDPPGSGLRKNMTLEALQQVLRESGETLVADEMQESIDTFSSACVKIRHRRNKWIAHFDRSTMLEDDLVPRMGPSRQEIECALEALRETMNCVSVHYAETTIAYEHFSMQADGEALIQRLRRGIRYDELINDGSIARDDYRKRFSGEV